MIIYQKKGGFTLIELLVVIAIIAILGAFLFPVFTNTKESALCSQDLSQLRQISMGILQYATNNEDYSVPCETTEKPSSAKKNGAVYAWPVHIMSYIKSEDLLYSPVDKHIKKAVAKQQNDGACALGYYVSWGYNWCEFTQDRGNKGIKMTGMDQPSSTLMLANSIVYNDKFTKDENEKVGYYKITAPQNNKLRSEWKRHNQPFDKKQSYGLSYGHLWPRHMSNTICNVSFADGHVESKKIADLQDLELWKVEKSVRF